MKLGRMDEAKARLTLEEAEVEERAERQLPILEAQERAERPATERREAWIEHTTAEREFGLIADRMGARVPERRKRIADTLAKYEAGKVPPARFAEVREEAAKLWAEDKASRKAARLAKREKGAAGRLYVVEPGPYDDATSPHSWVRDVLALRGQEVQSRTAGSDMRPVAVNERLSRHGQDVRSAIIKHSKFGQRAEAIVHEHWS